MAEEVTAQSQPQQDKRKTRTFQITFRGKKEDVTIRKMGYEERNEYQETTIESKLVTVGNKQDVQIFLHPFRARTEGVKRCVVKAPFDPVKDINDPDVADVGDQIYEEIKKFNNLDKSKKSK